MAGSWDLGSRTFVGKVQDISGRDIKCLEISIDFQKIIDLSLQMDRL